MDLFIYVILFLAFLAIITLLAICQYLYKKKRDIEARTAKNEELKSNFLTHYTQALRRPLKLIVENSKDIEDSSFVNLEEEKRQQTIDQLRQNCQMMILYINELQELTNFQGAIPSLSSIEVNLAELIMSYRREILHETLPGVSVLITTTMSPHCKGTFDTTMFRQLIMHLLRLGAQRTKEGSITINYEMENGGLRFTLSDTGYPIPENIRKVLFTDRFTDDLITHLNVKTTHVSLDICKFIIDSMHGTIETRQVESDRGIVVSFWFPCGIRMN